MAKTKYLDTMLFMRQMADLTSGGLTLNKSVDIVRRQSKSASVQKILNAVQSELEGGQSLSQALTLQNGFLAPIYIGLIRAGESSGQLESVLEESAVLLENEMETRQRVRTALAYPVFLLAIAICVCVFLTAFVVPRFEFLFHDLGQRLPLPTRLLIAMSVMLTTYGWLMLFIAGIGIFFLMKTKARWNDKIQTLFLKIPGLSDFFRGTFLQRWAQMMHSLLKSGFTLSDALALSVRALNSFLVSAELQKVLKRIHEGRNLKEALEASALFPPMACELLGAGEESGRLEESFARLAQSYKRETELRSKLLLALLEPLLILGMGLIVGFVAIAMLLPIFEMSAGLR